MRPEMLKESRRAAVDDRTAAPAGFPLGRLVIAVVLLGLAAWMGVRLKSALRSRAALADEREQVAKQAASETSAGRGPIALVRGTPERWLPRVSLDGTVVPMREANLGFKLPGKLLSIRVREGERVGAGETLATLDSAEATAQVQAASAAVKAAEAQLAIAEDAAHRTGVLVDKGSASQAQGTQASGQRALAAAQVEVARAQLNLAQTALGNFTLAAPFSGTVTRVPSGSGMVVSPGVPLFHVQDTSKLKLVATASEEEAPLLKPGLAVRIRTTDGRTATGRITAVLPSVDASTRRVPIEAEVPNAGGAGQAPLLGGLFVHAVIEGESEVDVLRLPASSLRPGSQDEVMVVANGRLAARHVVFAQAPDGALLVRRGLSAGEDVVRAPSSDSREGDRAGGAP